MLGAFTDPYPDEMLHSVYARLWEQLGCSSARAFALHVFGVPHPVWDLEIPGYLDHLLSVLPSGHSYSADGLIDAHTHLPLYRPFLNHNTIQRIRLFMKGSRRKGIQFLLGVRHQRLPKPKWLRYCPRCASNDRDEYGEWYWHRIHQVIGVEVCPHHGVWLEDSDVPARSLRSCHELKSAQQAFRNSISRRFAPETPGIQAILTLAQDAEWIMNHPEVGSDPQAVRRRYLTLLADAGFATYTGRVRASALRKAFLSFYPNEFLQNLDGEGDCLQSGRVVLALVHRIRASLSPIHHLLLIRFLGHTAESFFHIPDRPEFFGIGPWPCLNRAASHYQELAIKKCVIMQGEDGKPVGTFRCACGFVYMRVGPDWSPMVRYYAGRVLEYGSVWDRVLTQLWNDTDWKVEEIADRLGVTPPTVRAQVIRLGLPLRRPSVRKHEKRTSRWQKLQTLHSASERQSHREEWLRLRVKGQLSASDLHRQRQLQRWLRRHDREWLLRHGVSREKRFPAEVPREQVNWDQRDQMLAQLVEATIQRLKASAGKPRRLTRTYIIRETGQLQLIAPHLRRLPKTRELLESAVETKQEYLQRRAARAADFPAQRPQISRPEHACDGYGNSQV